MGTSHLGTPYMIELISLIMSVNRVSQNGTSPIVTLEERHVKAKSSMSLLISLNKWKGIKLINWRMDVALTFCSSRGRPGYRPGG